MKSKVVILSAILFVFILANLVQCDSATKEPNIHPLKNSWDFAVPHQEIPEGLASLSAKDCGACHQKHYEEWKHSTHSHAWTDLQFQAELKKETSPFMCINCHIPLQNQQEYIIKGLLDGDLYQPVKEKNPHFDKVLQQEGINCASCHVRDGAVIGPTGTKKAPHKTVKNPKFLSESLCISCHNAVAVLTPSLACTFETGDEWEAGPYFGKQNCISCHMEDTIREIVPGYEKRLSHLHYFAGSGIPKFSDVKTKMLNGLGIYPSKLKKSYSIKDSILFSLKVKNEFAGHRLPTGDPERFFSILLELKDERDTVIARQEERIGEHWEWYPEAKKLSDNNLLPNEERTYKFNHKADKKERLTLFVTITKNRLDKKSAAFNKLGSNYPLFITIFEEQYTFEVK